MTNEICKCEHGMTTHNFHELLDSTRVYTRCRIKGCKCNKFEVKEK